MLELAQAGQWELLSKLAETLDPSSAELQLVEEIVDLMVKAKQWDPLHFFLLHYSAQLNDDHYNALFYPLGMANQTNLLRLLVNHGIKFNRFCESDYGKLVFSNLILSKDGIVNGRMLSSFDNADSLLCLLRHAPESFRSNFGLCIVGKAIYCNDLKIASKLLAIGVGATLAPEKDNYLGLSALEHAVNAQWWDEFATIANRCSKQQDALHMALDKDLALIEQGLETSAAHIQTIVGLINAGVHPAEEYMPKLLDFIAYYDLAYLFYPNLGADAKMLAILKLLDHQKRAMDKAMRRASWGSIALFVHLIGQVAPQHAQALSYGYILFKALLEKHTAIATTLIQFGADVHYIYPQPGAFQGWSVLRMATHKECEEAQALLKAKGATEQPTQAATETHSSPAATASVTRALAKYTNVFSSPRKIHHKDGGIQCVVDEGHIFIRNRDL